MENKRQMLSGVAYLGSRPTFEGKKIFLGADDKYKACCKNCFYEFKETSQQHVNILSETRKNTIDIREECNESS